jgi:4-hydroxybenzoate polyprenyltransferase
MKEPRAGRGVSAAAPLASRLWRYQAERFPIGQHGLLIAAFGGAAACLSALLRGAAAPQPFSIVVSVICLFLFFAQLRIADEHKDAEDDRAFRPERPVPRGLVTLRELRLVAVAAAVVQAALVIALHPPLFLFLGAVWAWMALMSAEFFAPVWLRARPILYMASHMVVMPLIDLFASATDWLPAGEKPAGGFPIALGFFLVLSFANGVALEIARKSWAPEDERPGVETYSKLWGARRSSYAIAGAVLGGFACAVFVHRVSGAPLSFLIALALVAGASAIAALRYGASPTRAHAKQLELVSGLWVLASYLCLGVLPVIARLWLP